MYGDPIDLLDLSIFAYQLHAQTLVMRADPYGEYLRSSDAKHQAKGAKRRQRFLEALRSEIAQLQIAQHAHPPAPGANVQVWQSFGGPGSIRDRNRNPPSGMWPSNDKLDPVLTDYTRLSPKLPGVVRPYRARDGWIVYRAPDSITDSICQTYMVEYTDQQGPGWTNCNVLQVPGQISAPAAGKADLLYCFEGGTGAIRNGAADGAIWSVMGYVLAREDPDSKQNPKPWDLFIVFRGSRSGRFSKLHRATSYAVLSKGSSDWVTDLALKKTKNRPEVCSTPAHRGFSTAIGTMLPTIKAAVTHLRAQVTAQQRPAIPRSIHVTGHSLGGALATCFASAVHCGNSFWQHLQTATPGWDAAWRALSVTTFGAPPAGDPAFALQFNTAVRNVGCWRLASDLVPKGFLKLGFQDVGTDYCLPSTLDTMLAHSPDYIRDAMQDHLAAPPHSRKRDTFKPWKVVHDLDELLGIIHGELANATAKDWFNFKKGLEIYLAAFSKMKSYWATPGTDRFDQSEKADIQQFISDFKANGALATKPAVIKFLNKNFLATSAVEKFWEDVDLNWHIRAWLALAALEDGCPWQAKDNQLLSLVKQP